MSQLASSGAAPAVASQRPRSKLVDIVWRAPLSVLLASASLAVLAVPTFVLVALAVLYLVGSSTTGMTGTSLVVLLLCVYPAAWIARVLMRVFPLRSNGRRRWVLIATLTLIVLLTEILIWYLTYDSWALVNGWRPRRDGEDAGMNGVFAVVLLLYVSIPVTVVGAFPLTWAAVRHALPPAKRGLIYLRAFGRPGDNPIARVVLAAVPRNVPVAFIVSPSSIPQSWDLSLVALAGFSWLRPWSRVPLFLTSDDKRWLADIHSWIVGATVIVFDASSDSAGVLAESKLIKELEAVDRTLVLVNNQAESRAQVPPGGALVTYDLAWAPAVPRIILMLALPLASLATLDVAYLLGLPGVLLSLCVLPVALQPAVSRRSRREIRDALVKRLARP